MKTKMVKSEHHLGREVPLWSLLMDLAGQEGCDGEPYDEMQMAGEYIKELEERLSSEHILELELKNEELEKELYPYRKMERNLMKRIRELDAKEMEERDKKEEPAIEVGPGSHNDQPALGAKSYNGTCIICGNGRTELDHATITNRCTYCGQKYRDR